MRKKWVILLLSVSIVTASVFLYFKYRGSKDFEPLIKQKLQQVVLDASDSLYKLNMDKIEVDVTNAHVTVINLRLDIDSARLNELDKLKRAPDDVLSIYLKHLVIDGIGPNDLLKNKRVDLNVLYIKEPVVEFFHHKRSYNYTPPDTTPVYKKLVNELGHFSVKELIVQHVDFKYYNVSNNNKLTHFKNVTFNFKNLLIDSTTQNDSSRFFYATDANIALKDYNMATADSLYNFHADSLSLNAASKTLDLFDLSLKPYGKKENFSSKLNFYKDRYDLTVKQASFQKIDWWKLLSEESFTAKQMKLENGNIEVFADRTLPDPHKNRIGNYPHQLLMRLKLPVNISKIDVADFKVTYTELNSKTKNKGSVIFNNINGTFTNVTNKPELIAQHKYSLLDANASLMNAAPLHAVFKFDLANTNSGKFSLDVQVGNMNGKVLNAATIPLGLFEIKNAAINKIVVHMNANNDRSNGTVAFYYNDLEVEVLKQEEDANNLKKSGFLSFLANTFVIKKSNTANDKNKDPKYVSYKRDPERSFFNLIWKTIFIGLNDTVQGKNN